MLTITLFVVGVIVLGVARDILLHHRPGDFLAADVFGQILVGNDPLILIDHLDFRSNIFGDPRQVVQGDRFALLIIDFRIAQGQILREFLRLDRAGLRIIVLPDLGDLQVTIVEELVVEHILLAFVHRLISHRICGSHNTSLGDSEFETDRMGIVHPVILHLIGHEFLHSEGVFACLGEDELNQMICIILIPGLITEFRLQLRLHINDVLTIIIGIQLGGCSILIVVYRFMHQDNAIVLGTRGDDEPEALGNLRFIHLRLNREPFVEEEFILGNPVDDGAAVLRIRRSRTRILDKVAVHLLLDNNVLDLIAVLVVLEQTRPGVHTSMRVRCLMCRHRGILHLHGVTVHQLAQGKLIGDVRHLVLGCKGLVLPDLGDRHFSLDIPVNDHRPVGRITILEFVVGIPVLRPVALQAFLDHGILDFIAVLVVQDRQIRPCVEVIDDNTFNDACLILDLWLVCQFFKRAVSIQRAQEQVIRNIFS